MCVRDVQHLAALCLKCIREQRLIVLCPTADAEFSPENLMPLFLSMGVYAEQPYV